MTTTNQYQTPTQKSSAYQHIINGVDKQGKLFTLVEHNNNPLTIRRSIVMYFTKRNYKLLSALRLNVN